MSNFQELYETPAGDTIIANFIDQGASGYKVQWRIEGLKNQTTDTIKIFIARVENKKWKKIKGDMK